jgi:hypothetical protein
VSGIRIAVGIGGICLLIAEALEGGRMVSEQRQEVMKRVAVADSSACQRIIEATTCVLKLSLCGKL